jgi:TDG/mug DNA glycosylase family protein
MLILGSLPGVLSLRAGEYYAHPRNAFWPFVCELLGAEPELSYRQRAAMLKRHRIALWDVLHQATRRGSADAAIDLRTAVPNRFGEFLAAHRSIRCVAFNGRTAADLYRRQVLDSLPAAAQQLRYLVLPSTSPAYATLDRRAKLRRWSVLREVLANR